MKYIIIFNIFYILFNLNIIKSEIIIPFMRSKTLENNNNFIDYIINNNIYVTIPIGNPSQFIKFNVTMKSSSISITSFNAASLSLSVRALTTSYPLDVLTKYL